MGKSKILKIKLNYNIMQLTQIINDWRHKYAAIEAFYG